MLANTQKILSDVSAVHIDPLFLVRSQAQESTGFVMISYGREFYDLFYFRRSIIIDVTRLTLDFRFRLNLNTAISTFYDRRLDPRTTVSLFRGDEDVLSRFRSTFYFEPCMKVQRHLVQPKQLLKLIASANCRNGLLEVNSFPPDADPSISLHQFSESKPIELSSLRLKRHGLRSSGRPGRILIYDIDRNREMLKEKFAGRFDEIGSTAEKYTDLIQRLESNADVISASLLKQMPDVARLLLEKSEKQRTEEIVEGASKPPSADSQRSDAAKEDVDEIMSIIDSILQSGSDEAKAVDTEESDSQRHVKELIQNAFGEFSSFLRETSPSKADQYLEKASNTIKSKFPDFDDSHITFETSYLLLYIAAETIKCFKLKRNSVKERLIEFLADLYSNHFDLFEETNTITKIEELYRTLQ